MGEWSFSSSPCRSSFLPTSSCLLLLSCSSGSSGPTFSGVRGAWSEGEQMRVLYMLYYKLQTLHVNSTLTHPHPHSTPHTSPPSLHSSHIPTLTLFLTHPHPLILTHSHFHSSHPHPHSNPHTPPPSLHSSHIPTLTPHPHSTPHTSPSSLQPSHIPTLTFTPNQFREVSIFTSP